MGPGSTVVFLDLAVFAETPGAGRFIVNTLRIRENLGTDPAAERLLRNMLNYATPDLIQSPIALPAEFDQPLKAIGYR